MSAFGETSPRGGSVIDPCNSAHRGLSGGIYWDLQQALFSRRRYDKVIFLPQPANGVSPWGAT